jgi:hypothetical protein
MSIYMIRELLDDHKERDTTKYKHQLGYIVEEDGLPEPVACFMPGQKGGFFCLNRVVKRGDNLHLTRWSVITITQEQLLTLHTTGKLDYGSWKVGLYLADTVHISPTEEPKPIV